MNTASPSGSRRTHRFAFLLTAAQKRMHNWIAAQAEGATAARSGVLMTLNDDPRGAALGDVGRALDLAPSALSGLIDRMEASDLVRRRPDPEDGRMSRLHLTERGREARAAATAQARDLNGRLAAGFTDDELAVVARWLGSFEEKFPRGPRT